MELKLNMEVSANEFFNLLYDSIIFDVKESTNKKVTKAMIKKGYTYSKTLKTKMGKDGNVIVKIDELVDNEKYVASFKSSLGENVVSYFLEELEDGSLNVRYTEDFLDDSKMKSMNFSIMSFLFKRGNKKRAQKNLAHMEQVIIDKRRSVDLD